MPDAKCVIYVKNAINAIFDAYAIWHMSNIDSQKPQNSCLSPPSHVNITIWIHMSERVKCFWHQIKFLVSSKYFVSVFLTLNILEYIRKVKFSFAQKYSYVWLTEKCFIDRMHFDKLLFRLCIYHPVEKVHKIIYL